MALLSETILTADTFLKHLSQLPKSNHYWVALSGGVDSTVLLHLMSKLRGSLDADLSAIHVNHGLNVEADAWQAHCEKICLDGKIDLRTVKLVGALEKNESVEAWAREKRYQSFQTILKTDDILLTAHHQDDQVETLLMQLFRGAGPEGLASMPLHKTLNDYCLARPLLPFRREQITEYAQKYNLLWIEDNSNLDMRFDRNYLRNEILPLLKLRWPGLNSTVQRACSHQAEATELLHDLAEQDLPNVYFTCSNSINIQELKKYSDIRKKNIIRFWLKQTDFLMPTNEHLNRIIQDVIYSSQDKNPVVNWSGCEVRRYRNALFVMKPLSDFDHSNSIKWKLTKPLDIKFGTLSAQLLRGKGINQTLIKNNTVDIRFRQGGERIQPVGREGHHELKKLFQEASVLPWYRDRLPLIFAFDELVTVPGLWLADKYAATNDESGWDVSWQSDINFMYPDT